MLLALVVRETLGNQSHPRAQPSGHPAAGTVALGIMLARKAHAPTPPPSHADPSIRSHHARTAGEPGLDRGTLLKYHNEYRKKHGAAPLAWDSSLERTAQEYANQVCGRHSGIYAAG